MEHIPILQMGEFLLVTIQVDMHDRLAMALQDDLSERIAGARAWPVSAAASTMAFPLPARAGTGLGAIRRLSDVWRYYYYRRLSQFNFP
ncbi:MAG: hypothetical protein MUC60_01875 [Oscillatoria sp. Prado101]|jgi:rsbT antagonist protein RsbS|nr:hypothetical protein [Oscillatoria sp. Prado101]